MPAYKKIESLVLLHRRGQADLTLTRVKTGCVKAPPPRIQTAGQIANRIQEDDARQAAS
ncbi:unnamed protein product [Diplocarpon coronariae]